MAEGWIRLHRKLMEWEWYKKPYMVQLFIHILINANHKDGKWQGTDIKRGQLITGRKSLSENTGISERSIRTCLNLLKSTNEITIKTTSRFSIITICNYDKYQFEINNNDQQNDQQNASNRPATDQQPTTNNNEKNKKNEKKFIIPTIFEISEYCQERKNDVNPKKFFDFYESKGWMIGKNKMKDWKAAVRTWEKDKPKTGIQIPTRLA